MLPLGWPARVRDRVVEAPAEPGDRDLAEVGQHEREVGVIEGGDERETGSAQSPEGGSAG